MEENNDQVPQGTKRFIGEGEILVLVQLESSVSRGYIGAEDYRKIAEGVFTKGFIEFHHEDEGTTFHQMLLNVDHIRSIRTA